MNLLPQSTKYQFFTRNVECHLNFKPRTKVVGFVLFVVVVVVVVVFWVFVCVWGGCVERAIMFLRYKNKTNKQTIYKQTTKIRPFGKKRFISSHTFPKYYCQRLLWGRIFPSYINYLFHSNHSSCVGVQRHHQAFTCK